MSEYKQGVFEAQCEANRKRAEVQRVNKELALEDTPTDSVQNLNDTIAILTGKPNEQ